MSSETSTDPLLRYSRAQCLPDGRVLISTRGGSNFALSADDWREAMNDIVYLVADPEAELILRDLK